MGKVQEQEQQVTQKKHPNREVHFWYRNQLYQFCDQSLNKPWSWRHWWFVREDRNLTRSDYSRWFARKRKGFKMILAPDAHLKEVLRVRDPKTGLGTIFYEIQLDDQEKFPKGHIKLTDRTKLPGDHPQYLSETPGKLAAE